MKGLQCTKGRLHPVWCVAIRQLCIKQDLACAQRSERFHSTTPHTDHAVALRPSVSAGGLAVGCRCARWGGGRWWRPGVSAVYSSGMGYATMVIITKYLVRNLVSTRLNRVRRAAQERNVNVVSVSVPQRACCGTTDGGIRACFVYPASPRTCFFFFRNMVLTLIFLCPSSFPTSTLA